MGILTIPLYIVLYSYRAIVSTARWTGSALLWIAIFAAIVGVFRAISYVAESYWPASVIYGVILAGGAVRWWMDR